MAEDKSENRVLDISISKLDSIDGRLDRQDESRSKLHDKVNDLVMRMTYIEADHAEMSNVTRDVVALRTKAEGAGTLGRYLLRIGVAIIGLAGWAVGAYTYVTGRPPP